jgi:hypothetical protein
MSRGSTAPPRGIFARKAAARGARAFIVEAHWAGREIKREKFAPKERKRTTLREPGTSVKTDKKIG